MMKYADTDLLNIAYLEQGGADSPAVLFLHGWPGDATTWDKIMPLVVAEGYRAVVPWLRGFGQTTFKKAESPRTSHPALLAYDAIALMDHLAIQKFSVAGHDWGSSIPEALAVGWPARVQRVAPLSSPPRLNPDFVDITLHSYRSRWKEAGPDMATAALQTKIDATTTLGLPPLYIQGEVDGVNPPYVSAGIHKKFAEYFNRVLLPGVGHFPSREAPVETACYLLEFLNLKFD